MHLDDGITAKAQVDDAIRPAAKEFEIEGCACNVGSGRFCHWNRRGAAAAVAESASLEGSVVAMKATAIERVLGAADAVGAQVPAAKRLSQGNFSSNVNALLLLGHGKGCAGKASLAAGESLAPHAWRFCTNLRGLLFCC
ncbi:uncharacterized protein MONOS_15567 [Monocercomonoides exilis]|uniref:uncharacterized protein n=1 Tax=Monocercomonoides exilis TaxID=2049356 RepID=UPI003559A28E|nr:hypothetical protein MONOS_15567 [Monocercomonoides exilis]|eukprot:MONOS_15567.1-p1 / transcript=MONOS_15567.1 / gene=MONOS_15567 / organism=Monocercomonoides_exilis_PA203 / gene_product=unspecified product / transcript_product=unspecified product / location=Mono_scaffold01274:8288-8707(+) / protein_length=140 / sequence_SO=supercontig / SO=protein_coding / is_pseudo=false